MLNCNTIPMIIIVDYLQNHRQIHTGCLYKSFNAGLRIENLLNIFIR